MTAINRKLIQPRYAVRYGYATSDDPTIVGFAFFNSLSDADKFWTMLSDEGLKFEIVDIKTGKVIA